MAKNIPKILTEEEKAKAKIEKDKVLKAIVANHRITQQKVRQMRTEILFADKGG